MVRSYWAKDPGYSQKQQTHMYIIMFDITEGESTEIPLSEVRSIGYYDEDEIPPPNVEVVLTSGKVWLLWIERTALTELMDYFEGSSGGCGFDLLGKGLKLIESPLIE